VACVRASRIANSGNARSGSRRLDVHAVATCKAPRIRRIEAAAQAARRWLRLMLDILEERLPFFLRDAVLRFGRSLTGAVGTECNAATGEDSAGVSGAGAGDAIEACASLLPSPPRECGAKLCEDSSGFTGAAGAIDPCASPASSIRRTPRANLHMAPYHLKTESAVSSHSATGVVIRVRSPVSASRGAVTSAKR